MEILIPDECRSAKIVLPALEINIFDEIIHGLHRISCHCSGLPQRIGDHLTAFFLDSSGRRESVTGGEIKVPVPPNLSPIHDNGLLISKIPPITLDVDFSALHGSSSVSLPNISAFVSH